MALHVLVISKTELEDQKDPPARLRNS